MQQMRNAQALDFYPRPPRGGRRGGTTHGAGAGRDFYPRPPRGGRRNLYRFIADFGVFLSTPSARRATPSRCHSRKLFSISIHALREEGDACKIRRARRQLHFYPRPPRGGRLVGKIKAQGAALFLSTPSARRATMDDVTIYAAAKFLSTPSARRATSSGCAIRTPCWYFYPRPPRGGRQQKQRQNLYFLINYTTFCTNLEEP